MWGPRVTWHLLRRGSDRAGRWMREERGQALVLGALAMGALLAMSALAVDVGAFLAHQRRLQNAVDAAALAAARELPGSPTDAEAAAGEYIGYGEYDHTQTIFEAVTPGFDGDPRHVEVEITIRRPSIFGRVLGINTADIGVSAAAEVISSFGDDYAIFSIAAGCGNPGVEISGGADVFHGIVHANSNVDVGGNDHVFDPAVTYACDFSDGGSNNTYVDGQWQVGERPVPSAVAPWTYSAFQSWGCTYTFNNPTNMKSVNSVWIDAQKTQLRPGLYCFNRDVTLIGDDITGNVTFAAKGNITLSGSDWNLTPFHPSNIVMYSESSTGPTQIDASLSGGAVTGIFYAPNGDIQVGGSGIVVVNGSLVAQNVAVGGNGLSIDSGGLNPVDVPVVRLID